MPATLLDTETVNVGTVLTAALPDVPVLVSPADLATDVPIPSSLTWSAVPNATSYRVQVAADSVFSQMVADIPDVAALTLNVSGLSPATTYYWRANATGPAGSSDWSSVWSFTTTSAAAVSPIESMMPLMVMVMMMGMVQGMVPKEGFS
jgi:hypothetical protein